MAGREATTSMGQYGKAKRSDRRELCGEKNETWWTSTGNTDGIGQLRRIRWLAAEVPRDDQGRRFARSRPSLALRFEVGVSGHDCVRDDAKGTHL